MYLTFTSPASDIQSIQIGGSTFADADNFDKQTIHVSDNWGSYNAEQFWIEGACVCYSTYRITEECNTLLQCKNYNWLLNFILEGELSIISSDKQTNLLTEGNYYSFHCSLDEKLIKIKQSTKLLTICLTNNFMDKLINKDVLASKLHNMYAPLTTIATGSYLHSRMQPILADMMDQTKPIYIRRILIEAKILEILSIQLHQSEQQKVVEAFSREDINRLEEAKQIISSNLQNPCSLMELARRTGLNDFKLKKGFKSLFGTTVFGYVTNLRMESAYHQLQNGRNVGEVAEMVGYKNAHHFTVAFKRKFGFLPSQVK
ncbi:helix-turn-helix transcriptional regulator [Mucilaginibacter litoreus]|uniref:Helix-turn-helix transcriptional regulator n=1 Tax=Mucilaginibacter litoreus TaxID=1048221 RepID=A0ABW3ARZ9_9SPHI